MKHPLNFNWYFTPTFNSSFITEIPRYAKIVDLPHNMVEVPFNYFDLQKFDNVGTYQKEIILNGVTPERDYILTFEGVNNGFTLYVNGNEVNTYHRPYMEEKINITSFVKEGSNLLVVKVTGSEKLNTPPFGNTVDYLTFPGIYRAVSLQVHEALSLLDLKIDARANGDISLQPNIRNLFAEDYKVLYEVYDGTTLLFQSSSPTFNVEGITPWSVEKPRLYFLRLILKGNSNHEHYGYQIGFRDVKVTEKGFYLNGQKLVLIGLNRHETYPYIGGAAPSYLQYSDVEALKELGVNYVRTSHYPPSKHFLEACDFLGLLVIDEIPGWQHIGDETWQKIHLANIETMINRDYNHPSVIMWSIRINESVDHPLYTLGQRLAKSLDNYRPTTGTRNFAHSVLDEDVYSYNDFNHDGKKKALLSKRQVTKTKKPYIVSENNGHMFPTKVYDSPRLLEEHSKRHLNVFNAFLKDTKIIGMSPWCMHDYYSHDEFGSGDNICYHGVLDVFRNKKPAADVYTSNFTNVPTLLPLFRGDGGDLPESRRNATLVLSNAAYIDLMQGDKLVKRYYPRNDLYPYLPSAPYLIDTFISEDFISSVDFSVKDRKVVASLLNYAALHNFDRLTIPMKVRFFFLMLKYRLKREDLVELWTKNVALWGDKVPLYQLVGYNDNNQVIKIVPFATTKETTYDIQLNRAELENGETYDATTVTVLSLSPFRSHYDFSVVSVETDGPLKLLGPSSQALHGGALTLYFRSLKEAGSATITISVQNTKKSFNVTVK